MALTNASFVKRLLEAGGKLKTKEAEAISSHWANSGASNTDQPVRIYIKVCSELRVQ